MQQFSPLNNNDEIDLLKLISVLWKNKIWIVLTTLVFTTIAAVYAFTAKEQWTSRAMLIAPKLTQMGNYFDIRQEYNRILRKEPIEPVSLSNSLFANFNQLSESFDIKREFFSQSDIYKKLSLDKAESVKRIILSALVTDSTKVIVPDPKKEPNVIGRTITFSAETPTEAQDTLNSLIQFVNEKAFSNELEDFLVELKNILTSLNYEKSLIQQDLTVNRTVQVENLNKAYETAVKAGIKEYSKVFKESDISGVTVAALSDTKIPLSDSKLSDSSYLFMLGEKYLKAQIDVANEKGIVYPPRYYQIDFQIKQLEALLERTKQVQIKTYQYQASPDYPVMKDKPKKGLILIIGTMLGLIMSIFIVWVMSLIRQNKQVV